MAKTKTAKKRLSSKRPLGIWIIVILGLIAGLEDFITHSILLFSGETVALFRLSISILGLIGIYFLWEMKKIGLYIVSGILIFAIGVSLIFPEPFIIFLPFTLISLIYLYHKKSLFK